MENDVLFQAIIEIKQTTARTEEKVDAMSGYDLRLRSLEDTRTRVIGGLWLLGLGWSIIAAWATGIGGVVLHYIRGK